MTILSIAGVSVVFGAGDTAMLAVDDVSLDVEEGEFLCLLGPSGCGKSTLLKAVAGLVKPQRGAVTIAGGGGMSPPSRLKGEYRSAKHEGSPVTAPGRPKRELLPLGGTARSAKGAPLRSLDAVMVWQEHTLIPWRRIKDNVALSLELRGVPAAERHASARTALAALGIADFADHYPRQLSGGMRQRAGIARALVADPRILLMDEPFAAVDAQTRRILQEQVLELSQRLKKTIVFVTHSIEEALLLGDRIAVMSARPGRIKEIIDVTFARPRDVQVRRSAAFQDLEEKIWLLLRGEAVRAELEG